MAEPNKTETKNEWIRRCMESTEEQKNFPDNVERLAVCETKWDHREQLKNSDLDKFIK